MPAAELAAPAAERVMATIPPATPAAIIAPAVTF
jgi:hypothetical protein